MKFKINNDEWEIEEKDKNELKELYEKETQEKTYFVFGVTVKSKHVIYINKDMCEEQKIKTLKHELTHCYIWEYGLYNVMDINEEVICDIVACSNDFINEIISRYLLPSKVKEAARMIREAQENILNFATDKGNDINEYKSKHK